MTELEFYTNVFELQNKDLCRKLADATEHVEMPSGEILFQKGEVLNYIYFLESGVCRATFLSYEDKDITDCLIYRTGEAIMTSFDRLEMDIAAPYTVEVIQDSSFFCIPMERVIELMYEYTTDVLMLYNRILIQSLEEHREAKLVLYQYSATERYQWFLKKYPGLIGKVQEKHIASFLGMTPVSLSRLKKGLRETDEKIEKPSKPEFVLSKK